MEIKVEVKPSIDSILKKFKGFESILVSKLKEGIWGYALLVERGGKTFSPVDSGTMRSSIGSTFGLAEGGLKAIVSPNVSYAIFVHEGTRYMEGRPFMEWGLNAYRRQGDKLILNKVNEALKILGN